MSFTPKATDLDFGLIDILVRTQRPRSNKSRHRKNTGSEKGPRRSKAHPPGNKLSAAFRIYLAQRRVNLELAFSA